MAINPKVLLLGSVSIPRGFASASRPSLKAKIDKETCGKVIEAAETVKDGTKQVVNEVKRVGQAITEKVAAATGKVVADVTTKKLEKAAENVENGNSKDVLDTAKVAAEVFKDKISNK
ncbi:hypothetical protein F511_02831 [Dorcoceras hygrometricum]|uniref:Uncharacterized protein n=1 Tax=Dorcoceras hygrometricum TaxID=472368 RepID=A0A2Z7BPL5_9LAMI|nr:hypothetical protein F511_02831 [Dorcoceras hygrometricum]